MTHMPFRSWCPACVEGKAREKHHQKVEGQVENQLPEIILTPFMSLGIDGPE